MKQSPLLNLALALFVALAIGWLLFIGRSIILPIVTALISVYLMGSAVNALKKLPLLSRLPVSFLQFVLLVVFTATLFVLAVLTAATVREIAAAAPAYEANLDIILDSIATQLGLDRQNIWDELRAVTIGSFDLRQTFVTVLGGFTNVGAVVFLVVIYAAFLLGERDGFEKKISAALEQPERASRAMEVLREINSRISDYLATKTLINIVLAVVSFFILWAHGVDFAIFWAVIIGLLNYIPYVGSYLGVAFPVVLSIAQFASFPMTASLVVFLTSAQIILGNIVEPRFIGRNVNLSPTVVLVALSVWSAIWGIPGAILAVPLTSVLAIVLASFPEARFLAVLLADQVDAQPTQARETNSI